jgi:TRAP-type mannitol/chloroaromatic compound transport system substrate-binding protein
MEACYNAAQQLYTEESARNPKFKKIYDQWKPFLAVEDEWFRVEEQPFDSFMYSRKIA